MTQIDQLVKNWIASTAPALTWYGVSGERIELSGHVLQNWVSKSANLLLEELEVEPGSRVSLVMNAHWKSLVIALATWACGAELVVHPEAGSAGVLATDSQKHLDATAGPALAVALGALQLNWDGDLPDFAIDYAAQVRMFADSFERWETVSGSDPAITVGADSWNYSEFGRWLRADERVPGEADTDELTTPEANAPLRVALNAQAGSAVVLRQCVRTWLTGGPIARGSVVLCEASELITERLLEQEGAVAL